MFIRKNHQPALIKQNNVHNTKKGSENRKMAGEKEQKSTMKQ